MPLLQHYGLDTLPKVDSQAFRRISSELSIQLKNAKRMICVISVRIAMTGSTLVSLMSTLGTETFASRYVLVDCRYPFEYAGGHITVSGQKAVQLERGY